MTRVFIIMAISDSVGAFLGSLLTITYNITMYNNNATNKVLRCTS